MRQISFSKSVLQYESLPLFLSDYYKFRKKTNVRFSYESWARALAGIRRSYLKQIADGERSLPAERAPDVIKYFNFDAEERVHFLELVALAGGDTQKKDLRRKISERVRYHQELALVQEAETFLMTEEMPMLLALLTYKDISRDPESLAGMLEAPLTKIEEWLENLEALGLAYCHGDGHWGATKGNFRIPTQMGREALRNFQKLSLKRAMESLEAPPESRHFETTFLALSPEEYREYILMLGEFRDRVSARFNTDSFQGRRLYRLNAGISAALSK